MRKNMHRAAFTLEATIIMPTILICMFAILFAFQLLYQHVVIEYAASYGATRGAMMWDYDDVDFMAGTGGKKVDIYQNLNQMLSGTGISEREEMIRDNTEAIVQSLTVMGGDVSVSAKYDGNLLGRSIVVEVSQKVEIPFDMLLTYFNDGDMELTARSSASLYDPDEFIRNADYAYELVDTILDQVKDKFDVIKKNKDEIH